MIREDLSRNFGYLVNDVARLMRTVYDRRVRKLGLTRSQWWVLNHIFRHPGVTQSELAAILEIERATLGRLLDRLEAKRWVRRDRRSSTTYQRSPRYWWRWIRTWERSRGRSPATRCQAALGRWLSASPPATAATSRP